MVSIRIIDTSSSPEAAPIIDSGRLNTFVVVAREGGFSRAARRLRRSGSWAAGYSNGNYAASAACG
jgi:hypothetical protein